MAKNGIENGNFGGLGEAIEEAGLLARFGQLMEKRGAWFLGVTLAVTGVAAGANLMN